MHNMNPAGKYKDVQYDYRWNKDGYPASSMYTYIKNDIYNSLPKELQDSIMPTTVVSEYGKNDAPNKVTTDKLYLLSTKEVWGLNPGYDSAADNTRQLDYYKDVAKVTTSSYGGAIKKYNGSGTTWWLRSAHSNDTNYFYHVYNNGYWSSINASITYGVAVAFRLG